MDIGGFFIYKKVYKSFPNPIESEYENAVMMQSFSFDP